MAKNTPQMQFEYQQLFDTCIIKSEKYSAIDSEIDRINSTRTKYEAVSNKTGVPWYFIGIIHHMEGSGKFTTHLHNGDPLTKRTVHVPKGRPLSGAPPFQWEDSACDAIQLRQMNKVLKWDIPTILYQMEGYNGFGYRVKGIHSPYLWSFSNHYLKGKYTSDGIYDANAVSKQIGAAVMLRRMAERQIAIVGQTDIASQIKILSESVKFSPKNYNEKAAELQRLLNNIGQPLKVDGLAGRNTSDALFRVTGKRLRGDVAA